MAVSEVLRHELHGYFTELMDKERAAKVMEVIPAVDWADLATKQDLDHLREITELRFDTMATREDIAELRAHMDETLRKQLVTIVTCMVGLVTGMAGLLGAGAAIF